MNDNFWAMMTETGTLNKGKEIDFAKCLFIRTCLGLKTISHSGSFVGFRTELIRFPEERLSIAIFANRSDANLKRGGFRVADILLREKILDDKKASDEMQTKTHETSFIELNVDKLEAFANYNWWKNQFLPRRIYVKNDTLRYF